MFPLSVHQCSPRLLGVLDSGDVKISGITLTDPVYWALHVWRGVRVVIDGVTIRGDRGIPNTDGGCWSGVLNSDQLSSRLHARVRLSASAGCRTQRNRRLLELPAGGRFRQRHNQTELLAGIDVDGSRYVTIRNVDIDTADDAIAVKATGKWPTSHVTVTGSK